MQGRSNSDLGSRIAPECSCAQCDSITCFTKRNESDTLKCTCIQSSYNKSLIKENSYINNQAQPHISASDMNKDRIKQLILEEKVARERLEKKLLAELNNFRKYQQKNLFGNSISDHFSIKNESPGGDSVEINKEEKDPAAKLSAQVMNVSYDDFKQSTAPAPNAFHKLTKEDIMSRLKDACKACSCKVCECFTAASLMCDSGLDFISSVLDDNQYVRKRLRNDELVAPCKCRVCDCSQCSDATISMDFPILSKSCKCDSCQCIDSQPKYLFRSKPIVVAPVGEDRRTCDCSPCECTQCTQNFGATSRPRHEMSTEMSRHYTINCLCETCPNTECEVDGVCQCERTDRVMRKPVPRDTHNYDLRYALANQPMYGLQPPNIRRHHLAMFAAVTAKFPTRYPEGTSDICNCTPCECLECVELKSLTLVPRTRTFDVAPMSSSPDDNLLKSWRKNDNTNLNLCKCELCSGFKFGKQSKNKSDDNSEPENKYEDRCECDFCNSTKCENAVGFDDESNNYNIKEPGRENFCSDCNNLYPGQSMFPIKKSDIFNHSLLDSINSFININNPCNSDVFDLNKSIYSMNQTAKPQKRVAFGVVEKNPSKKNGNIYLFNQRQNELRLINRSPISAKDFLKYYTRPKSTIQTQNKVLEKNENDNIRSKYLRKNVSTSIDKVSTYKINSKAIAKTCITGVTDLNANSLLNPIYTDSGIYDESQSCQTNLQCDGFHYFLELNVNEQLNLEKKKGLHNQRIKNCIKNGVGDENHESSLAREVVDNKDLYGGEIANDYMLKASEWITNLKKTEATLQYSREFNRKLGMLLEKYEKSNADFRSVSQRISTVYNGLFAKQYENGTYLGPSKVVSNKSMELHTENSNAVIEELNSKTKEATYIEQHTANESQCTDARSNIDLGIINEELRSVNRFKADNLKPDEVNTVTPISRSRKHIQIHASYDEDPSETYGYLSEPKSNIQHDNYIIKKHQNVQKCARETTVEKECKFQDNITILHNYDIDSNVNIVYENPVHNFKMENDNRAQVDFNTSNIHNEDHISSIIYINEESLHSVNISVNKAKASYSRNSIDEENKTKNRYIKTYEHKTNMEVPRKDLQYEMKMPRNVLKKTYKSNADPLDKVGMCMLPFLELQISGPINENEQTSNWGYSPMKFMECYPLLNLQMELNKLMNDEMKSVSHSSESSKYLSNRVGTKLQEIEGLAEMINTGDDCLLKGPTKKDNKQCTSKNFAVNKCDVLKLGALIVQKLSESSVLVTWKTPQDVTDVEGYEVLVDGRIVQRILSRWRCVSLLKCLPRQDSVVLDVRTITVAGVYLLATTLYQPSLQSS